MSIFFNKSIINPLLIIINFFLYTVYSIPVLRFKKKKMKKSIDFLTVYGQRINKSYINFKILVYVK